MRYSFVSIFAIALMLMHSSFVAAEVPVVVSIHVVEKALQKESVRRGDLTKTLRKALSLSMAFPATSVSLACISPRPASAE